VELTIDNKALTDAVSWAAHSLAARPSVPVLAGLRLLADDAQLTVSGLNYQAVTSASAKADIAAPGTAVVAGRLLSDIVKALPDGPVHLTLSDAVLQVVGGPYRYHLQPMSPEDYPTAPDVPQISGHVPGPLLATAVGQVAVAAGRDEALASLTGIHLEAEGERLRLVATDRYRLAVCEIPWRPIAATPHTSILVPAKALAPLMRVLGTSEQVALALPRDTAQGQGLLGVHTSDRTAVLRLLDGEFIAYERIFPAQYAGHAVFQTAALIDAVKRIALVADRSTPVRLVFGDDQITVQAGALEVARAQVTLDARHPAQGMTLAFNPEFLLDGLAALGSAYARVDYTQPAKPAVLTALTAPDAEKQHGYRYLVIPVRVAA